ncbi:MAG: type II secretion system F family protein [Chloroflexi bacterium]|nr:type II secretion system F family protein [Chloroflexota bacterium]
MDLNLLLSIVFASGILLLFIGLDLLISSRTLPLDKRMSSYASKIATNQTVSATKKTESDSPRALENFHKDLTNELSRAGLPLTANEYTALMLMATLIGLLIGYALFRDFIILAILPAAVGFFAPRWYLRYLQDKRMAAFDNQLAGTLTLLANALRSGYAFSQAVETVASEAAPPTSIEFKRIGREVALGLSMDDALANLLRRNPSLDLELVVMAININRQTGGNLSEVLDQIASTIRERTRLVGELRSLTAQQRFTALILTMLPPSLMVFIYIANPTYLSLLWTNACGWVLLAVGATLMFIGYFVIRKIMAIKF